jgi:hypothetical protein
MLDFREVLSHCGLHGLGFAGLSWTYDNKQKGNKNVKVMLDSAVVSPSWSQWFREARAQHLISSRSDHCLVFLNLEQDTCSAISTTNSKVYVQKGGVLTN